MRSFTNHGWWFGWLLLTALPWLGAVVFDCLPEDFFHFPPLGISLDHPGPVMWVVGILLVGFAGVMLWMVAVLTQSWPGQHVCRGAFPWWGWGSLLFLGLGWWLAWSRYAWFAPLQHHTYVLIWFPFTLLLQALTQQRSGTCLLRRCPVFFAWLYGFSAVFWWFFEYLNRFVQNWEYQEVSHFSPLTYGLFATLSFATVLPGVGGMYTLLCAWWEESAFPVFDRTRAPDPSRRGVGWLLLAVGCLSLLLLGVLPFVLFPFVWLGPLWLIEGWRCVTNQVPLVIGSGRVQRPRLALMMLAGLLCGVCWELWNAHSLARWIYHIPYAGRFYPFEMPLAGYAGYLPFGLQCIGLIGLLEARFVQR